MGRGRGVVQIPPKYRAYAFGQKTISCRTLKKKKISGSLNQGVAKDFA